MSGSTGHGTRWSLPFKGARGDSLTPQTAGHNRCNPWRTPVRTISAFRGEPSDPLARTHSLAANPAPTPSSDDGIRTPNPATELSALPGCIRERTERGNRPEQQMHHSVWPPSTIKNNTHSRYPPSHRKNETLTGQTEPPPRQCWKKRHTSNCEDTVGSIPAKRNLRLASAGHLSSHRFIVSSYQKNFVPLQP